MNSTTVIVPVLTFVIGGLWGYMLGEYTNFGQTSHSSDTAVHEHKDVPHGSLVGTGGRGQEMGGMEHMMDMRVESERAFIEGMIPHHEEAVATAKEVLLRGGTTPEIRTLAENIITAQEREIERMKGWYATWYGTAYESTGTYKPMMRDLSALSGKALDRAFLEDMIMHHMGAIMMAESNPSFIEHEEMRDLTEAIISTQTEEIRLMRTLLESLTRGE
jgi:uncharacterized protein (DUF305 family)